MNKRLSVSANEILYIRFIETSLLNLIGKVDWEEAVKRVTRPSAIATRDVCSVPKEMEGRKKQACMVKQTTRQTCPT